MANLCFYTDINLLLDQNQNNPNDKAFGPIDNVNYRVTNLNTASSNPPIYAICDGSILVQKDSSNGLYNLLLKPSSNLISDGFKIKYIIYKGIISNSFIDENDATMIAPQGTNALIDSIWDTQNSINSKTGSSDLPSFKSLGLNFDSSATGIDLRSDTDLIDNVFFLEGKSFASPPVDMGWKIGTFDKDKFGIEVVLDDFGYNPAFKILRTNEHIITVPNISPSTIQEKIEDHANRKLILNYLDPVCLFSMGYSDGVICYDSGSANPLKTTGLFSQVLSKFINRNKVYIDLRNENGFYYNYYDNYGDTLKIDFGGGINTTNFKTNSWPIKIIENSDFQNPSPSTKNSIALLLPQGDNNKPLIYQANNMSDYSFPKLVHRHKQRFLTIQYQSGYSNEITCSTHNQNSSTIENIGSYVKLFYIRRQSANYVPANSSVVYSEHTHFDNLFELSPQRVNFDSPAAINAILYSDLKFIDALDDFGFSGMVQTGFCTENNRIIYFAVPIDIYLGTELDTEKLATFTGINSNNASFFDHIFFSDYAKKVISISISGISAKLISIEEKNKNNVIRKYAENIFCFGISKAEFNLLNTQLTSFNTVVHPVYLGINSVTHAVDSSSQQIPYSELRLSLKGLDTSSEFLEYTQTDTLLLTNSGNTVFSPDSSFNENSSPYEEEAINIEDNEYNFNIVYRLGANVSGTKWPLYKLNGSPEQISPTNTDPVLLPLGTRVTILKTDYVNVSKMNKRKLKVFLWYSKNGFADNGFRLGYIEDFARRTMVWPRALPSKSDDYPLEVLESFVNDMELYLFITVADINSLPAYNDDKYSKYTDFVENIVEKASSFRTALNNAINLYPSDPDDFNIIYNKFKNLYQKESYDLELYSTKNINIPLNKLSDGTNYYDDYVKVSIEYLNIIKTTGVLNNRFTIFVKENTTSFTLSNSSFNPIVEVPFDVNQNELTPAVEPSVTDGIKKLFGLSVNSPFSDLSDFDQQIWRDKITVDTNILPDANGIIYTINLKPGFDTQNITSDNPNVILSNKLAILPISFKWGNKRNNLINNFTTNLLDNETYSDSHVGDSDFSNIHEKWTSPDLNSGLGYSPTNTLVLKAILKKIADEIWDISKDEIIDYEKIRDTPEAKWLREYFITNNLSKSISNFIGLERLIWADEENPSRFFQHHSSKVGIDQSIGILNSNPVLGYSFHEANQDKMYIDIPSGTDTHNPQNEFSSIKPIWENYVIASHLPVFNLFEVMNILQIDYHLPLVYIHYYLNKINL